MNGKVSIRLKDKGKKLFKRIPLLRMMKKIKYKLLREQLFLQIGNIWIICSLCKIKALKSKHS